MRTRHAFIALVFVLILMLCTALYIGAEESVSITIEYEPGICPFDFYKIADVDEYGEITLAPPFDDYADSSSVLDDIDFFDSEKLRTLSTTLEALIGRDQISPKYEASTDESGSLTLENIERGIYLIIGTKTADDKYTYSPSPIFVCAPSRGKGEAEWQYDITVELTKFEKEELDKKYTECKVIKIWLDGNNQKKRPASISACLMKDGKVHDTVILSKDNNWTHTWKELSAEHTWSVVEKVVPNGYSMTVEKNQNTFVIKNTVKTSSGTSSGELPQTGQLWLPVPVMLIVGIISFTTGWLRRRYI